MLPSRLSQSGALRRVKARLLPSPAARSVHRRWYLARNTDVAAAGLDPAQHYLQHGWSEGRWPNPWFDPQAYLQSYPDVALTGVEPLTHYLAHGREEGRRAGVALHGSQLWVSRGRRVLGTARGASRRLQRSVPGAGPAPALVTDADILRGHFDAAHYAVENPELEGDPQALLEHFVRVGWRERRNPSRTFDVQHYLEDNPDVAAAGINPLLHWVQAGQFEGRSLRPPLTPAQRRLRDAVPPRARALVWAGGADRSPALSFAQLQDALAPLREKAAVVLSVSHDDYVENTGGVQQMLTGEQQALQDAGMAYLHIAPAAPLPMLADPAPLGTRVRVRLDGERVGVAHLSDLQDALVALTETGVAVDAVVHQLMGHAPESVAELLEAVGVRFSVVFAHDYFSLCENYALLRNDLEFCGAPPVESPACSVCVYGGERTSHVRRMQAFHERLDPVVLLPSGFAAGTWERGGLAHAALRTEPLARLVEAPDVAEARLPAPGEALRVAHLGTRSYLKGWHVFSDLAWRFAGDPRYTFVQLGLDEGDVLPPGVQHIEVRVGKENPQAMIEALAAARVDVVLLWSLAAETFSFTTYEALAAGAFVVCRAAAGNVWPAVRENAPAQGLSLETEEEVTALFDGPGLRDAVLAAERRRRLLVNTSGAADEILRRRLFRTFDPSMRSAARG